MTSVPAAAVMPGLPVLSPRPVRPPALEAAYPASAEAAAGGEAASGTAFAVPVADLMALLPVWRSLPMPDPQLQVRLAAGQWPPPGGKNLPPRIPVVPIELPSVESRALPAGEPVGTSTAPAGAVPLPQAGGAAMATRLPVAPVRTDSLPAPSTSGDAPVPEPASQQLPREVVRLPVAPVRADSLPAPLTSGGAPVPEPASRQLPREVVRLPEAPGPAPAPATVQAALRPPTNASQPAGEAGMRPRLAAGILPEGAPPAEPVGAGAGPARLAAAPDAGIVSAAATIAQPAQPAQPGSPAVAIAQQHLPQMVGSEEWAEAVAQRVSQLAESPQARANIRLNPPQLGPMQIEVHVDGDRAVVQLAVHHDMTREALEQAMPRLRAQLEGSGFSSIDVSVSRNPQRERPDAGQPYADNFPPPDDDLPLSVTGPGPSSSARLLDAYA